MSLGQWCPPGVRSPMFQPDQGPHLVGARFLGRMGRHRLRVGVTEREREKAQTVVPQKTWPDNPAVLRSDRPPRPALASPCAVEALFPGVFLYPGRRTERRCHRKLTSEIAALARWRSETAPGSVLARVCEGEDGGGDVQGRRRAKTVCRCGTVVDSPTLGRVWGAAPLMLIAPSAGGARSGAMGQCEV